MDRYELAAKLRALGPGESLSVPLYTLIALFGSVGATFDEDAMKQTAIFGEQHGCQFDCYMSMGRDPEFFKPMS
jgi:hypothetical protein